jgi:hypothetical protein
MSAEIEKMAVYDSRIVQERPAFGVVKGGLSYSNSPFNAIASTSSQMSFNVNVPSQNVFLDREVLWSSGCDLRADVVYNLDDPEPAVPALADARPILVFGGNVALAPFPLHQSVSTMTATINDTVSTMNTSDVLNEVLRFVNQKKNRLQRTCPTMLDKYADYSQCANLANNPQNSYSNATDYDNVPNGAFWDVVFTDAQGNELVGDNAVGYPSALPASGKNVVNVRYRNGIPVVSAGGNTLTAKNYDIYVRYKSTEKLVLSPFIFSEECGDETGLFGMNNIQLVMNFQNPNKLLRLLPKQSIVGTPAPLAAGLSISDLRYRTSNPWVNPVLNCLFITPSLDLALPPKSVVPYLEYPRYLSNFQNKTIPANSTDLLQSQTIVLPQIPDMLVIYCKAGQLGANATNTPQFGDFYLPLDNITMNFDNYSGLLSSHTREQLYNISVDNGLEVDWNAWNGLSSKSSVDVGKLNTVGGFLVLRFGKDIQLQSAQAPSVVGNYTLQFTVRANNRFDVAASNITLFTMTVNSGFFETQSGSSRILKGVLTESDVINARENASAITRTQLERMVGGSFWSKLGTALNKAKDVLMNPMVRQGIKTLGKQTPLKGLIEGAEKLGYGVSGGMSHSGGASTGGKRRGRLSGLM